MFKRYSPKVGLPKDVHLHLLRYTFAIDLSLDHQNIQLVQEALGQASLFTTMIYTNVVESEGAAWTQIL